MLALRIPSRFIALLALLTIAISPVSGLAEALYKPFVTGAPEGSTVDDATAAVTEKLKTAGLEIVGSYSPYDDGSARIIGVTSSELKKAALGHKTGGFGAVMRVAITNNDGVIEVSYTNPPYHGYAYHIGGLPEIEKALHQALGGGEPFGGEGFTAEQLERYHYMMFMPYFQDAQKVVSFDTHAEAQAGVENALKSPGSDMTELWKVELDSKQILYGVQLNRGWWKGQIKNIMAKLDTKTPRSTAALPWEVLVSGGDVYYLPGKFRIALMFPDLPMGAFMKISDVPDQMDASAAKLGRLAKAK